MRPVPGTSKGRAVTDLAARRAYALAHPLNDPGQDVAPYRRVDVQRDGNLLMSILAVDR